MSHHRLHHNTDGSIQALYHPCIPGREVVYLLTTIQTETELRFQASPGRPDDEKSMTRSGSCPSDNTDSLTYETDGFGAVEASE